MHGSNREGNKAHQISEPFCGDCAVIHANASRRHTIGSWTEEAKHIVPRQPSSSVSDALRLLHADSCGFAAKI